MRLLCLTPLSPVCPARFSSHSAFHELPDLADEWGFKGGRDGLGQAALISAVLTLMLLALSQQWNSFDLHFHWVLTILICSSSTPQILPTLLFLICLTFKVCLHLADLHSCPPTAEMSGRLKCLNHCALSFFQTKRRGSWTQAFGNVSLFWYS